MKSDKKTAIIDDRPFEMLTQKEKDEKWMRVYGKPYTPPTAEERNQVLKEFGLN